MFGTAPWQLELAETDIGPGVLTITGAVVSTTLIETMALEALPEASLTVTVIVWAPVPRSVPAAGF